MALAGYEVERQRIQSKIDEINARLGGRSKRAGLTAGAAQVKRPRGRMSAEGRRKIALAQKRRWAEYRKKKTA
jgi:hypothetical protein